MGRVAPIAAVAVLAWVGPALGQWDVQIPLPNLAAEMDGGVAPRLLPRRAPAAVRFSISSKYEMRDGSIPPALEKLVLQLDRRGTIDVTGLPVCGRRQLRSPDTAAVEAACGEAIVGTGVGKATLAYPESTPFPAKSELLVLNGGTEGSVTTFYIHGRIPIPRPTAVVATVRIEEIDRGRFGWLATVRVPRFAEGYGFVTEFDLRFKRRFGVEGKRRTAFGATCRDGRLEGRTTTDFRDGTRLKALMLLPCTPKPG